LERNGESRHRKCRRFARTTLTRDKYSCGTSPDTDAIVRREVEFFSGLDIEGFVPAVDVADGGCTVHRWGMGIGEDLLAENGVASDGTPGLSKGDEELLVAGEGAVSRSEAAFERCPVAIIGGG